MKSRRLMPANMAEAGVARFAAAFRTSADNLDFCLEHEVTSPRRGEVDAHRQMRGG
jgi:hypothetical protein